LSSSIKEFTPRILGEGTIGQFSTVASFQSGFAIAATGALLVVVVMLLDRLRRTDDVRA
jgi:hypothetical protein